MKTLFLSSLSQYNADLALAFERLDWKVWLLSEEDIYKWLLRGERPNLVIGNIINPSWMDICEDKKIPHVYWVLDSWYQSPNLIDDKQQAQAISLGFPAIDTRVPHIPEGKYLWSFSVSQELLPMLKGQAQVYLPFGVNELRFKPMPEVEKKYDVGFIGTSLLGLDHLDGQTILSRIGLGREQVEAIEDIPTRVSWQMLCGMRSSAEARVEACRASKAHVWGDGWNGVDGVVQMGKTDFKTTLPTTINECWANLNVSREIFPLDLCPRLFETLACGGVLISNKIKGAMDEFGPYAAWMELKDMTPSNLMWYANKEATQEMAREGRQFILDKHTWVHRAKRILEVVGC